MKYDCSEVILSPNIIIKFKQKTMRITEKLLQNILCMFIASVTISNMKLEEDNNNNYNNNGF